VQVDVAQVDPLVVSDQSIDIPYTVTIKEVASTSSEPSTFPPARWLPARMLRKSCPNTLPVLAARSIYLSWPSAMHTMPGAISIAPSFATLHLVK